MVLYIHHKGEEILKRNDAIATLSPFKKTIQGQESSKRDTLCASFAYHNERYNMWDIDLPFLQESAQIFLDEFV